MRFLIPVCLLSGALALGSCASDTKPAAETPAARSGSVKPAPHLAAPAARKDLSVVYGEYLDVKDALVKSDATAAKNNAGELLGKLAFDVSALTPDESTEWDKQMQTMKKAAGEIAASGDVKEQRKSFADLSAAMEAAVRAIGLDGKTVYKQYCPMAFDGQGGYWLAGEEEVNNPYYGDEMLHCGGVEDTLAF